MISNVDYALMAGRAYQTSRDPGGINWFPVPQNWTEFFHVPNSSVFTQLSGGFEATSFVNSTGTGIVISFAGTAGPLAVTDNLANLGLATGAGSSQLVDAAAYYLQVRKDNPNAVISFTGHSLGGGIAALMGIFFNQPAVTFDQAPFAASASTMIRDYLVTNLLALNDANNQPRFTLQQLTSLAPAFLSPVFDAATRTGNVSTLRVAGEFTSSLFPFSLFNAIGAQTPLNHGPTSISSFDLHAQSLLTAFVQSDQTAVTTAAGQKQSLSQVTYKLTDLLGMIFDKKLFAHDTDPNTKEENLLEHLVRHEAGVQGSFAADAMVTRITADLWKLAQDGGLTMSENLTYSNWNNVSRALIAFAMQKYYEETTQSAGYGKQLFTDLSTAGTGSNGIRFDIADVSANLNAKITAGNVKYSDLVNDIKGFGQYFQTYLDTTGLLSPEERTLIKSMLPAMRDWYVQAGASGMNATDTLNRGAFMLGGTGVDTLTGGTAADLLVGNAGNDILVGGQGNDLLLGGSGNDTYKYTNGGTNQDGLDTILDSDGQGSIVVDGATLAGGAQFGDARVHRDASGHLYTDVGRGLIVDGNIVIEGYQATLGNGMGLTLTDPVAEAIPQATITGTANNDIINLGLTNIADDVIDAGAGQDYVFAGMGNDTIIGGAGNDALDGWGGNDRLYADTYLSVADAITLGNTQTGTGLRGDALSGDDGNDTLVGSSGNDILSGGAGADLLIGGTGDDYIFGDTDWAAGTGDTWGVVNNVLVGGAGGIAPFSGDNADVIYAGAGDDHVWGQLGNDVLFGEGGADFLVGGSGNDIVLGGDNNDIIYGDLGESASFAAAPGNDYLDGGAGDDKIYGNEGDDILIGGTGNDTLVGGTGQDTYIYNAGDGKDWIYDTKGEHNILRFGAGVNSNDITLRLGSLMLDLGNGNQIHIANFDRNDVFNSSSISSFEFADGTTLSTDELLARGFDLVAGNGNDTILGTNTTDRLSGLGGNDYMEGGAGNDILNGGTGNDILNGGIGSDTYLLNQGDGQDIIMDSPDPTGNVIQFGTSITAGNTQFIQQGADLLIQYGTQGDTALIQNFAPNGMAGGQAIARFQFADGSQGSYTTDGAGNASMKAFDVNGRVVGDFWQTPNGYGNDTYTYNAQGIKTGNSWTQSDGSHGSDVYNADGSSSGTSFYINGTSSRYTNDGLGNIRQTSYDSLLNMTGDSWIKADGSHGSDIYNGDGSSSGTIYNGTGINCPHSTFTNDGRGDVHTIGYDALGAITSDIWSFANGNYSTTANDGLGNITTTIYNAQGIKVGYSWSRVDGSHGNDNFNSDGSSSGAIYQADGSYDTYTSDGLGQIITKNYNFDGSLTGSNITETNGLHNVISSHDSPTGVKLSETWIHSDGSSGRDLVSATDYNGFYNIVAAGTKRTDTWHLGQVFEAFYTVDLRGGAYVAAGSYNFNSSGNYAQGSMYIYGRSGDSYAFAGASIYDDATGVWFDASINKDGSSQIWGGTSGRSYSGPLYAGSAQTPVTLTVQGANVYNNPNGILNGLYSTLKLDGQGNGVVVDYNAQGIKLSDMWLHNDGINGMDMFNADGSSSGFSTNLDGSYTAYTDDGHGHVVVTNNLPVTSVIIPPSAIALPPPLSTSTPYFGSLGTGSSSPGSIIGGTATSPLSDGKGGQYILVFASNGSVIAIRVDANGNILSSGSVQTDPGYGADTIANGKKSGWAYDAAGIPISSYSDDGLGNVTTCFYDASGHVTSSSVATKNAQGNVTSILYDAAWRLSGTSIKTTVTIAAGQVQETTATYDVAGHFTGSTIATSDAQNNSVTYNYDAAGVPLAINTMAVNSTGAVLTFYNANGVPTGVITTSTSSQGVISTHNYDANGNLISSVIATPDNMGNVTTCNYDASGALTSYVTLMSDSQHDTLITTYDAHGIKVLENILRPDGIEMSTSYHPDGSHISTMHNLDRSYSITANDGMGNVTTTDYSALEVRLSDTWTRADGSHGTDTFNADGSVSGTVTYADGTSGAIVNNGHGQITIQHYGVDGITLTGTSTTTNVMGNLQTTSYGANGIKLSESWVKTDGVSGSNIFNQNGSKSSDRWTKPDGSFGSDIFNADGSHSSTVSDRLGTSTVNYDASGIKLSDSWTKFNGTSGSHVFNADGSYSDTVNDGHGSTTISNYDASGIKLNDSWTKKDGSYGNDIFNADGSSNGVIHHANGGYSDYINDGHGNIATTDYDVNGSKIGYHLAATDVRGNLTTVNYDAVGNKLGYSIAVNDGLGGVTTMNYDAIGNKLSYKWTKADGTWGDDTFNVDGTSSGTSYNPDGSYSKTSNNIFGNISTNYFDIRGKQIGDTWSSYDGSYGSDTFSADGATGSGEWHNSDGSYATYTYSASGKIYNELDYAANGVKVGDYWNHLDGSWGSDVYLADGSSSGDSYSPDNTHSAYTNDGHGNIHTLNYDVGGVLLSDSWVHANGAPVLAVPFANQTASQGVTFTYQIPAGSFTDPDVGDSLTYTATLADGTILPSWLTFDAATQTFSGTPGNADVSNLNLHVTATDKSGLSTSSNFALNVINVNDPPVAHADTGTATEGGGAVTLSAATLLANDTDPDSIHGDVLNIIGVTQAASGAAVSLVNGDVQYDIGNRYQSLGVGQTATDTFSYTISDVAGATSTATVTVTITGTNDAPVTSFDVAAVQEDLSITATGNVLTNDRDVDQGTVLTVANAGVFVGQFGQLTLQADGSYSYALDNFSLGVQSLAQGQVVTETFAYQATDGITSTPSTLTVTITGTNDAPVTSVDTASVQEDLSITAIGNVLANDTDVDQGTVLTVANAGVFAGQFGLLILQADGNYSYALDNASLGVQSLAQGQVVTETFTYHATDGITSTPSTLTVTITGTNDAPVVVADNAGVIEDLSITATGNVLMNDTDVDQGTVLRVANAGVFAGQFGQLTLNADGSYAYALDNASLGVQSLAQGQTVTETFAYQATDGITSTPSTLTVTITGTNDAPVTKVDTASVQEDLSITATGNVLVNDSDVDQGTVLTVANAGVFAGQFGQLTLQADGSYTYALDNASLGVQSLAQGQVVIETFAYQATDGITSTPSTLTVTITGTNDAPVTTVDTAAVQEDISVIATGNVLTNDSDVDQGTVLSVANAGVFAGQYGQLTLNADGSYSYALDNASLGVQSLAQGQVVTETFAYQATDGITSTPSVLTVTITGTNDAPVTTVDTAAVQEDMSITATGNVLANDTDVDQGTVLTVANAGVFVGQFGQLTLQADGSYIYALDNASLGVQSLAQGQVVTETFAYQATDGITSTPSTLTVTITGTNDAPVTTVDTAAVQEDLSITATGNVLANDSDVDQGTVLTVANAGVFTGNYGSLVLNVDGSYTYALDNASLGVQSLAQGQVVTETFAYQATDGITSTPSILTVTITGTNDAPVTTVDTAAVQEDPSITATGNVLTNDSDVDQGTVLSVANAGVFAGQFGQLTLNADGSYTYALDNASLGVQSLAQGQTVTETFAYHATDGIAVTPSTLTVTITGTNDAPVVASAINDQHTLEDVPFSFTVPSATFTDIDQGDVLTYHAAMADGSVLPSWLKFDAATLTFSGIPSNWDVGVLNVSVTATDTGGLSATDTFALDVQNVNDAPVVANHLADQHVENDHRFNIVVPANTFDDWDIVHGDSLRYSATLTNGDTLPDWLKFDATTRSFSGKAEGSGNWDILLTATDQAGASVSQVFNLSAGSDHHDQHHDDNAAPVDTTQNELIVSSTQNDIIHTGNGADTVVFQRGDGRDTLYGGVGTDNTIVLAGGIQTSDIALTKQGNDLILEVGHTAGQADEQITFRNWYDSSANYKSVLNLEIINNAVSDFDRGSDHQDCGQSIDQFDFTAVVNAFDQACGTGTTFQHWNATNSLMAAHLEDTHDSAQDGSAFTQASINSLLVNGQAASQNMLDTQTQQRQAVGV